MKIFGGIVILLLVTLYVWHHITIIELGYEIQQLQQEQNELHRLHQEFLIEAATLGSLDRIERIATSQLGLVRPRAGQVILVRPATIHPVPGESAIKMAQTKEDRGDAVKQSDPIMR